MTELVLVAVGLVVPLVLRAELWRACLPTPVGRREVLAWTAVGFALNQLVGFRSGDLVRVTAVRRRGGAAAGATSVLLFRAIELCALLLLGAAFVSSQVATGTRAWLLVAGAAGALLLAPALARRLPAPAFLAPLAALTPLRLACLLGLALLANTAEASLFMGVAGLLGQSLDLGSACFLLAAVSVGGLAAIVPANLGTFEASGAAALAALGWQGAGVWLLPAWSHAARLGASALLLAFPLAARASRALEGGLRWPKLRT